MNAAPDQNLNVTTSVAPDSDHLLSAHHRVAQGGTVIVPTAFTGDTTRPVMATPSLPTNANSPPATAGGGDNFTVDPSHERLIRELFSIVKDMSVSYS